MFKKQTLLLACTTVLFFTSCFGGKAPTAKLSNWTPVGTSTTTLPEFIFPGAVFTLDNLNNPVVGYSDESPIGTSTSDVHVRRWTGSTWEILGGALTRPSIQAYVNGIAVDNQNRPIVAYEELNFGLTVKRWNGTNWEEQGEALPTAVAFAFTLDNNQLPIAVIQQEQFAPDLASKTFVARLENGQWTQIGSALASNQKPFLIKRAQIKVDKLGQITTAFMNSKDSTDSDFGNIVVKRLDGNDWLELGAGLTNNDASISAELDLTLDSDGIPYIAWTKRNTAEEATTKGTVGVQIRKWTAKTWLNVVGSFPSETSKETLDPSIVVEPNGSIVLAYSAYNKDLYNNGPGYYSSIINRWTGTNWEPVSDGFLVETQFEPPYRFTTLDPQIIRATNGKIFVGFSFQFYFNGFLRAGFEIQSP
jgi:hypothetical protein